jgi:hypothetical protein
MTSRMSVGLVAFTAFVAVTGAGSAGADNTTCENAVLIVPNGSAHTGSITAGGQRRWFKFVNTDNRSYSIEIENLSPIDPASPASAANMGDAHAGSCSAGFFGGVIDRANVEPVSKDSAFAGGDREVVMPPWPGLPGDFYFSVSQNVGGNFRARVEETTLFSPAWSTAVGAETYWTVQNTTNEQLFGTLVLLNAAGGIVLKVDLPVTAPSTMASIAPGGSYSTNTLALGVADNQSGSAVFFHNGPPGAVQIHAVIRRLLVAEPVTFQTRTQIR